MSTIFEYRRIIKDARVKITELEEAITNIRKKQARVDARYGKCKSFAESSANMQKSIQLDKDIALINVEITELNKLIYRTDVLLIAVCNKSDNMQPIGW